MVELNSLLGKSRLVFDSNSTHKWNEYLGIELELENVNDPTGQWSVGGWTTHQDASLRNGIEFVTHPTQGAEQLETSIRNFFDRHFTFESGPRTSTHIHINMRDSTDEVLASMVLVVYMIEDAIYQSVEESRKWGGYSVALAEMPTSRLRNLLSPTNHHSLLTAIAPTRNADRYYGMNTNMNRHGTVEFRYFPGGPTKQELCSWIDLVVSIKKAAKKYSKDALIGMLTSPDAVVSFLLSEFGDWGPRLLDAIGPERMFNSFAEAATMAGDEDPRELSPSIIWVSSHYLEFLEGTIFKGNKESMEYLRNILKHSNVMSKPDWSYYMTQARNLSSNARYDTFIEREEYDEDEDDEVERYESEPREIPAPDRDAFQRHQERIQEMLRRETERVRLNTTAFDQYVSNASGWDASILQAGNIPTSDPEVSIPPAAPTTTRRR